MSRSTAKDKTQPMSDTLQPGGSACEWHGDALVEPFGEYLRRANRLRASKAANHEFDLDRPAVRGQIVQGPLVLTTDAARGTPTAVILSDATSMRSTLRPIGVNEGRR